MRDLLEVTQKLLHIVDQEEHAAEMKSDLQKFACTVAYQAPEVRIASGAWGDLYRILMSYKDQYHSHLWYCQVVSLFSTNSLDDVIRMLAEEYGTLDQKSTE